MYKVILFDYNCPSCTSGVYEVFCDDIGQFEREWMKLETDERRIDRFRRSKVGEIVIDYYSDDPELNMVQKDENVKIFYEKTIVMCDKDVTVHNGFYWPSDLHIDKSEFQVRYVRLWGRLLRLVKYKLTGISQDNWISGGNMEVSCYGNPVLKNNKVFCGKSYNTTDYSENTIESIVYFPLGTFETEEEMRADYDDMREDFFSAEELDVLLSDIPGDAG